ncbi:glycosyltransferase [Paenibacillus sp. CN-4]|uniref:glycosyltransferase n=1 Tax=Paenibacillus nanchangensis TaxID=3348343 RepID=UPI00397A7E26
MSKSKPDVVLVNMAYHTMVAAGIKLVAGSATKLIVICHDVITLPFGPHSWIDNPLLREELVHVSGFIGDSDFVARYITEWGGYSNAVSLRFPIYGNGVFPTFHNFAKGYIAICNPTEIKGLSIFLKLAQAFPDYPFAAVITWGNLKQDEQSALRALPNVTLLEPERDMNLIFEQVRVWLHPSICAEAFGQTVIEAMLRGIPVIASDQGGLMQSKCRVDYNLPVTPITETYKDEGTGLTMPVIPEQDAAVYALWVETLRRLLTDKTLYESISAASKAAAQKFIMEAQPEKFELYLESMLQSELTAR